MTVRDFLVNENVETVRSDLSLHYDAIVRHVLSISRSKEQVFLDRCHDAFGAGLKWFSIGTPVSAVVECDPHYIPLPQEEEAIRSIWETTRGRRTLPILVGESGSGKTWTALGSLHYAFPDRASRAVVGFYVTSIPHVDDTTTRDKAVFDYVVGLLRRAVVDSGKLDLDVVVVFDEVGARPVFLCGLIAQYEGLRTELEKMFHSVLFLACGTGAESVQSTPGSLPQTYQIIHMSTSTQEFFEQQGTARRVKNITRLLCSPELKKLTQNRRCASLLVAEYSKLAPEWQAQNPLQDGIVKYLAFATASKYRNANSLRQFTLDQVSWAHSIVLNAIMLHGRDTAAESRVDQFLRRGVLTDRAVVILSQTTNASNLEVITPRGEEPAKGIPNGMTGRYTVTQAQLYMLQTMFGSVASPRGGSEFEEATAYFLENLLRAVMIEDTPTLNALLRGLVVRGPLAHKAEDFVSRVLPHELRFDIDRIHIVKLRHKLEVRVVTASSDPEAESTTLDTCVNPDAVTEVTEILRTLTTGAALILNANEASAADLYLVLPSVAIFFVHAKCVKDNLSLQAWKAELYKMGFGDDSFKAAAMAETYTVGDMKPLALRTGFQGNPSRMNYATHLLRRNIDYCGGPKQNAAWYGGQKVKAELCRLAVVQEDMCFPLIVTKECHPIDTIVLDPVRALHVASGADFEGIAPTVPLGDPPTLRRTGTVKRTTLPTGTTYGQISNPGK
jgi:hypothetical protein